jgi:hypothetical protein
MGLGKAIPSTSKPMYCRRNKGEGKCGNLTENTISGTVEILGKLVNVKIPCCDSCLEELKDPNASYSIKDHFQ